MDYRFCPYCGAYLEKNYYTSNAPTYCPVGHFTVHHNVTAITTDSLSAEGHSSTKRHLCAVFGQNK